MITGLQGEPRSGCSSDPKTDRLYPSEALVLFDSKESKVIIIAIGK